MNYNEFYGKYWRYTQRQWRNVGVVFDKGTTFISNDYILKCLEDRDVDALGYICLFIQIMILKNDMKDNTYFFTGVRPELLYDRWTWKCIKLVDYVRGADGNIKPNVRKHPYTHILNTHKMWLKQLACETFDRNGYAHRASNMYDKTTLLTPNGLEIYLDMILSGLLNKQDTIVIEELDEDKEGE